MYRLLFMFLLCFAIAIPAAAQNWDLKEQIKANVTGKAEVAQVDEDNKMITFKVFLDRAAGEYKNVACYVDEKSQIIKNGAEIRLDQLEEGDEVNIIYTLSDDADQSCGRIVVVPGGKYED